MENERLNEIKNNHHIVKPTFYDYIPLLEILNEAIVIYDDERILWANEEYARLRGYDRATEVIGLGTYSTAHPDEVDDAKEIIRERERTGKKTKGTWRMRKKDGSFVVLSSHSTVLPNLDNKIILAIVRPVEAE